MRSFNWRWNDPDHLAAHRDEFSRPVEQLLEELRPFVADAPITERDDGGRRRLWVHTDAELSAPVGISGLREVPPDGSASFWAYRRGRRIPSHLCLGEGEPTCLACIWGWWEDESFVIHTLYPGRVAPREIHDPELPLRDIPAAIEFWRRHAIITREGAYAHEPY